MKTLSALLLCASLLFGQAQTPKAAPEPAKQTDTGDEKPVITHHKITLAGKALAYTATTGFLPIKDDQGHVEAHMFYVAYTVDNSGPKRPLTFAFNGGPGSATIWLHMGCFGPKRVKMRPNGFMPPPPFEWEENQNTILDRTDIGTGLVPPQRPSTQVTKHISPELSLEDPVLVRNHVEN